MARGAILVTLINNFVDASEPGHRHRRRRHVPARHRPGADSRRGVHLLGSDSGRRSSRRNRSPTSFPTWPSRSSAGATPGRRWRKSSRSISTRASAWSGWCGPSGRVVDVYTTADRFTRLTASHALTGATCCRVSRSWSRTCSETDGPGTAKTANGKRRSTIDAPMDY